MGIKVVTVTNRNGWLGTDAIDRSDIGKIVLYNEDRADHYAVCIANDDPETRNTVKVKKVTIVMPLGGANTGLFRFPLVGDIILVVLGDDGEYYMLGYVPSVNQSFELPAVPPEVSEAPNLLYLRYTNQEQTYQSEVRVGEVIQLLAGDIHNHVPLAEIYDDKVGDEEVSKGVNIRTDGKVVIRAGEEIELRVGHSAIRITDWGITLTSRKAHRPIALPWDSTIKLGAFGLSLFGGKIEAKAGYGFGISDMAGDSIAAEAGLIKMTGKDVTIASISHLHYLLNEVLFLEEGARVNLDTLVDGTTKENSYSPWADDKDELHRSGSSMGKGIINSIFGICGAISAAMKAYKKNEGGTTVEALLSFIETLNTVLDLIFDCLADIEYYDPEKERKHFIQLMTGREIYLYTMVILPGLTILIGDIVASKEAWTLLKRTSLHLTAGADCIVDGAKESSITVEQIEKNSPWAGTVKEDVGK